MNVSENKKINLICLPYAGGTKHSMRFLKTAMPESIHYYAHDYPGRGMRIKEKNLLDINEIVEDLYTHVKSLIEMPYAVYGHSMGAIVAYLLVRKIEKEGKLLPLHLFISGTDAPSVAPNEAIRYLLPKDEFIKKVHELGGLPNEVIEDKQLIDFFEPILRADFQAIETYNYVPCEPMAVPITVMVGESEKLKHEDVLKWNEESKFPVNVHVFSGNHFFIFSHEAKVSNLIKEALLNSTR